MRDEARLVDPSSILRRVSGGGLSHQRQFYKVLCLGFSESGDLYDGKIYVHDEAYWVNIYFPVELYFSLHRTQGNLVFQASQYRRTSVIFNSVLFSDLTIK